MRSVVWRWLTAGIVATAVGPGSAWADGPADNVPAKVRRVPALGIEVSEADRSALEASLGPLERAVAELKLKGEKERRVAELWPDVAIYAKAVRDALTYREIFDAKEIPKARALLAEGQARAESLATGEAPWESKLGLVVRGYVSKIDGSAQPYGLVIPPTFSSTGGRRHRLDVWFHGRGENLSELNFLDERRSQAGTFTPDDTIVLHPYGRYCNGSKFAGEVDALEAIDSVSRRYRVDDDRVSVRGFSLGGASAWHFAVHYSDRWFAANPGAGFAETPRFLDVFQKEKLTPTPIEQALWNLYDCDKVAVNLLQVPTIAYSGELDNQKQAADVMAEALLRKGVELTHIIGPGTKHQYHPESRREVERRMADLARLGRDRTPTEVHFATYTLRYPKMNWITIEGLAEHWAAARIDASIETGDRGPLDRSGGYPGSANQGPTPLRHRIKVDTHGVTAFSINFPAGTAPFDPLPWGGISLTIDNKPLTGLPLPRSDRSWLAHFTRKGGAWSIATEGPSGLVKRSGLQGPIDDAFMDSFLIVRPTGTARSPAFAAWQSGEMTRAIEHWRRHFRGEARVKDDTDVTADDVARSNLVLWGDDRSNVVLGRIAGKLPIGWREDQVVVGDRSFAAADHAPIAIYPNPENPGRYVVLNSGFTYREYDYLNNARQVPKLPDWAIVDLKTPPDSRYPGKVVAADFFGEAWEVKPAR